MALPPLPKYSPWPGPCSPHPGPQHPLSLLSQRLLLVPPQAPQPFRHLQSCAADVWAWNASCALRCRWYKL